jgi:ADP-ribose pyrophosphatase YjhB (NUDIX family)
MDAKFTPINSCYKQNNNANNDSQTMSKNNNSNSNWKTHITVAAVIKHNDKYLLVTDVTHGGLKLNQPAGHVEDNEGLTDAITREVKEETGLDFQPKYLVGIYLAKITTDNSYLRFCFGGDISGDIENPEPDAADDGVIDAHWYSLDEIKKNEKELRTPLVKQCINDFLAGKNYPIEILAEYKDFYNIEPENVSRTSAPSRMIP